MGFSVETVGRLWASGRNYANLGIGFAAGIGVLSAAQNQGINAALTQIYDGVSQVITGATSLWQIVAVIAAPIVGPILARMASKSAKTDSQAASVVQALKDPNTPISLEAKASVLEAVVNIDEVKTPEIKVADPVLANLVPSNKVKAVS